MVRVRDLFAILVTCLALRALMVVIGKSALPGDGYYISLAAQLGMYVLVAALLRFQVRPARLLESNDVELAFPVVFQVVVLAAVLLFGTVVSSSLTHAKDAVDGAVRTYAFLSTRVVLFVLVNSIVAGLVEEIFFRKFLLVTLVRRFGVMFGLLFSSVPFALFHLPGQWWGALVFSMLAGLLFLKYGKLGVCWIFHGTFNLLAFIWEYYFLRQHFGGLGSMHGPGLIIGLSLAAGMLGAWVWITGARLGPQRR